ncbi:uncharacterized protein Dwil_GK24158 [Drosophila willistoni]|uniref:COP9 signalosome complex subunit 8 n=1 Tax=Drosophila willistoni TaxID=7260 RepID=B4N0Z1_DROWI|nr:COP9 signalosome complex subunit 8 [Drosophila willistoni]EDW78153.1 uncharacterized protein Dwil_GK24158 [Drosophila willistoni]
MQSNKYKELLQQLESEELEHIELTPEVYQQLMAIYLYQNELSNAKLLWMRIPDKLKVENKELAQLNLLNLALHHNNYADFFKHINYNWSENVKSTIDDLFAKQREDIFTLTGNAYVSIYEEHLLDMVQMAPNELRTHCASLGWTQEQDGDRVIWLPKAKEIVPVRGNDDQLLKLTEFVTFLEN